MKVIFKAVAETLAQDINGKLLPSVLIKQTFESENPAHLIDSLFFTIGTKALAGLTTEKLLMHLFVIRAAYVQGGVTFTVEYREGKKGERK